MDNQYIDGLVSVIIPTYNSATYIKKTVDSVLAQTYENFEIIIVDDCSKDSTREVLEGIAKADSRVHPFIQEKNNGAAVSRNVGINNAKGRYIAFLDSDDLWEPNKLEKQMVALKEGNPFVFSAMDIVDAEGNQLQGKRKIKEKVTYKDLLTKTYISTSTVIYDRVSIGNPPMPLRRTGQDYAFWMVLLKKSDALGIDEVLVHYTRRGESLSKSKLQSLIDVYEVQTKFENINKVLAAFHVARYFCYALKKKLSK